MLPVQLLLVLVAFFCIGERRETYGDFDRKLAMRS
jgi:hypothetical protein